MMIRMLSSLVVVVLFHGITNSQNRFYNTAPLPLTDLSAFNNPEKNWVIAGNISGSFDAAVPKKENGVGILFNEFDPKKRYDLSPNLITQFEHGDIFLSLDFLTPKGSNSGIYLQGRYEIQLFDSWGVSVPHSVDCGSIYERWDENRPEGKKGYEGHPPRTNACRAPNLWQHLDIEFKAPRFDAAGKKIAPAQFVSVTLNGQVIHENIVVTGPTRASAFNDEKSKGPLMLQGDHGQVAFRNISYAILNDFQLSFRDLVYEYYEGDFNDFPKVQKSDFVRRGKAEVIDVKLADNPNKQCLIFTGKIDLKESTDYQFLIKKIGKAKLSIDGEEVIRTTELFDDYSISKKLSAGEHTIIFSYLKDFSWAPTGMGLFIGKLNSRPQAMHTSASLPPLPPTPLIDVIPGREPERIRSFMQHNGKKKTHVISVGDPKGVHYTYDLNKAGLLQVWKGEFLNATEMWHERGEPQVATAMGPSLILTGSPPIGMHASKNSAIDSITTKDLIYKGYTLDANRYPTFEYQYKEITFTDSFVPTSDGKGLTRTLKLNGKPSTGSVVVDLGSGTKVQSVADNDFAIDDQRYFIHFTPPDKTKTQVISGSTGKMLTWEPGNNSTTLTYILYW